MHYGDPDARGFKKRTLVEIDYLARRLSVHKDAKRHFLRLERLFEARAPEYAARISVGALDDWSYIHRDVSLARQSRITLLPLRWTSMRSLIRLALTATCPWRWFVSGGSRECEGGHWSRTGPIHFETQVTPEEIQEG